MLKQEPSDAGRNN